jgi:4a-hydroxytetrahydrobiopterin dehydratase
MARQKLSKTAIDDSLTHLPGWQVQDGKLYKQYKFGSFAQALGWMVAVGVHADKMDHHPEWSNVYNRVTVFLVTHDLGNAISNLDVELAQKMEALADAFDG